MNAYEGSWKCDIDDAHAKFLAQFCHVLGAKIDVDVPTRRLRAKLPRAQLDHISAATSPKRLAFSHHNVDPASPESHG